MPVDSKNPRYKCTAKKWKRMRDVLGGEDTVKEAGDAYLPRMTTSSILPEPETNRIYEAYKERAQFFNATARTLGTLQGFIFRKDPTVTVPDKLADFMDDCTMEGLTFYDVTKQVVLEVLAVGRFGTLVDFDAEVERRPYLVGYGAETIINWRVERVAAEIVLTLLVLHEMSGEIYEQREGDGQDQASGVPATQQGQSGTLAAGFSGGGDEFEQVLTDQWRVFRLMRDDGPEPYVQCSVYRRRAMNDRATAPAAGAAGTPTDQFVEVFQTIPTRRGIPLSRIPFVFHGVTPGDFEPQQPPLEDLALVNLSLYRTSADLENGRHVAGIPTPWAAGFTDENTKELVLGTTAAWTALNPQAKCGFLEFTGEGLGALEKAVEQKQQQLAALGARMLEPEAKKAEAFDTVAVRSAAETSALMNITVSCTQSLSTVLRWAAWWLGTEATPEEIADGATTELNTEYTITSLPADQLTAILGLWQGGAIDFETLFWKLQQGEIFPPDADIDTVRSNIEQNPPMMQAGLPDPNLPDPNAQLAAQEAEKARKAAAAEAAKKQPPAA